MTLPSHGPGARESALVVSVDIRADSAPGLDGLANWILWYASCINAAATRCVGRRQGWRSECPRASGPPTRPILKWEIRTGRRLWARRATLDVHRVSTSASWMVNDGRLGGFLMIAL